MGVSRRKGPTVSTETESPSSSRREATESEAREVAEAARDTTWTRPSFAKELYLGRFDLDLIHPHPRADADTVERGEAFLTKLREVCEKIDGRAIEREAALRDEDVAALAEIGCFGMKVPTEYGGLGLSMAYYGKALMLAGSIHPTIGALLSAHQSIGVPEPVKAFGTEEQKQAFLPRCAKGAVTAFLLTEPDVGSDPARLDSTAVPSEDGSSYTLDGVKLWTTNGVVAELVVVMAQVPPHAGGKGGITAFVVETDSEGITVENRNQFMGLKGLENGVTRFHNVQVPVENRIGREGEGLKIALTTLNTGRLVDPGELRRRRPSGPEDRPRVVVRAGAVGPAGRRARRRGGEDLVHRRDHVRPRGGAGPVRPAGRRRQQGHPDRGRARQALVQRDGLEGGRRAGPDSRRPRLRDGRLDGRTRRAAVPAEQILRDLRINRIFEGSTEIMHLLIAREAVDAHLQAAGALADKDASGKRQGQGRGQGERLLREVVAPSWSAARAPCPTSYAEFGALATHLRFVERSVRKLARQTFYGMSRWQAKLEYRQSFLGRIVDIGAELFAMAAVCSRAAMLRDDDPTRAPRHSARRRVLPAVAAPGGGAVRPAVDQHRRHRQGASPAVLTGDYAWLEAGVIDQSEGTGPWISTWAPGPSEKKNVWRPYGA